MKYFYGLFKYLNNYDGKYEIGTTPVIQIFSHSSSSHSPPLFFMLFSLSLLSLSSLRVTFVQKFPFNLVQFSLPLIITDKSQINRAIRSDFYSLINLLQLKLFDCAPNWHTVYLFIPHDISYSIRNWPSLSICFTTPQQHRHRHRRRRRHYKVGVLHFSYPISVCQAPT